MTQTVTSGRRRASDDRVHQPVVPHRSAHTPLPSRRSLRLQPHPSEARPAGQAPVETAGDGLHPASTAPPAPTPPGDAAPLTRRGLREQERTAVPPTVRRVAGRPTPFARLRDNAATAGIVLASAGLVMGAVAPSAIPAPVPADGTDRAPASGVVQAVTASAEATVDFGLESAGRAAEGIEPGIASARALSSSLTPAAKERKAFGVPVEDPVVASTFGYRVNPMGGSGAELHTGLDYAGACGTPVKAADAGTVVDSGWHAYGGGQRIVIEHGDGLKTTYNHMSVLGVPAGTTVQRGDLLGAVGSTGNSTGCHLHFEVLVNDEKADPQPWL